MIYSNISRRLIILATLILVAVIAIIVVILYFTSFVKINITLKNSNQVAIYKLKPVGDNALNKELYKDKPVLTVKKDGSYKLKKGSYFYIASPSTQDYQEQTGVLDVNSDTKNFDINLTYTQAKLNQIYESQKPNIINALNAKYPTQMKNYSLQFGKLYEDGNWFGGYLVPDNNTDKLQVILKQKGANIWEVAATPNITISSPQYPEIPKVVIDGVNVFPN